MLISRSPQDSYDLHEQIPELHHYTSVGGLHGIVSTDSLWATHYRDLNDSSEVNVLRPYLREALYNGLLPNIRNAMRQFSLARRIRKLGNIFDVANHEADLFTRILYEHTFGESDRIPFAIPFISSFCSHANDSQYERENGLLSQWRGYAQEGFCLVFDTELLVRKLSEEVGAFEYIHVEISPVRYLNTDLDINRLLPGVIQRCVEWETAYMEKEQAEQDIGSMGDVFNEFVSAATLLKHRGFQEEQEVRIVAVPTTEERLLELRKRHDIALTVPLKNIHSAPKQDGHARRYIVLFETSSVSLPILRIIVGPSRDQEKNKRLADSLVKHRIPVVLSETPYLG